MSVKNAFPVLWDYTRIVDNLRIQILHNPIKTPLRKKYIFNRQFVNTYVAKLLSGVKSSLQKRFEVKAFKSIEVGA